MKKRNIRKSIVCGVTLSILLSNVAFANAQLESLKEEKKELDKKMQNQEAHIQGINIELNQVVNEIKSLDYQISKSQQELENINFQLQELETSIETNEKNLSIAKENLNSKQDELSNRIREQYKSGDTMFLEILMGSSGIVEMLTKMDIVKNIVNQDKELLDFTNKQIEYIRVTEEKLKAEKKEYQQKLEVERTKKEELEAANNKKIAYMAVLENDKATAELEYDNFVNLTTSLDKKIVSLEKELEEKRKAEEARREALRKAAEEAKNAANNSGSNYSYGNGELLWPVSASTRISSYYGYRIHPIFNTRKFHSGIDIPAAQGTSIRAVSSGIVIYSGWQGGYGNVVMISHGDNLVTVYAHNSTNTVSVGQYVEAGQTISLMGSTGYSTGPHLHFEVRVNGSTVNPLGYL